MDRRTVLLTGGTAAVGALAGCLGGAQSQPDDRPDDEDEDAAARRTVRVSQSGEVTAEPDLAILRVAVEASGDTARSVRDELAARSETLREALIAFGIDEDDVTTARYDISERRAEPVERPEPDAPDDGNGEREVTYEGVHAFTVDVRQVDEIGAVIDEAVDAGADTVGRAQFTLTDETREQLREEALRDAMGNARSEADVLAGEANGSVVDIREIRSSDSSVRPVTREIAVAESADGGGGTELTSGEVTVTAHVEVTYEVD